MLINKINFQYPKHLSYTKQLSFKGEYDDRVSRMEDRNSIFSSAYWNAGEIVERQMRSEISSLERQIAEKEAELRSREQAERSAKSYHSSSLSSLRSRLSNIRSQINYNNRTVISDLQRTLSQLGSQGNSLRSVNNSAKNAIEEQKTIIDKIKNETKNLLSQNEMHQKQLRDDMAEKVKVIDTAYNEKLEVTKDTINNSIIKPNPIIREINMPKANGFGSIAGFAEIKKDLTNGIGKYLVLEKNGKEINVPNGILLYGPDTYNNQEFAKILANQFGVSATQISTEGTEVERFNRLKDASVKAKENFEQGNGRTLVIINDLEKFVPKNSRLVGPLKSYLDTVSKDYHATVIATTTTPEVLDDILLRSGRFGAKVGIPAMNKADILSNIKKYINIELTDDINIDALAQSLEQNKNGGAYSVKQLKEYIISLTKVEKFKDLIPEIKPEVMQTFKRQIEFVKHL